MKTKDRHGKLRAGVDVLELGMSRPPREGAYIPPKDGGTYAPPLAAGRATPGFSTLLTPHCGVSGRKSTERTLNVYENKGTPMPTTPWPPHQRGGELAPVFGKGGVAVFIELNRDWAHWPTLRTCGCCKWHIIRPEARSATVCVLSPRNHQAGGLRNATQTRGLVTNGWHMNCSPPRGGV